MIQFLSLPRWGNEAEGVQKYFCMYDGRIHPDMPIARNVLFKVRAFLLHLSENFHRWWEMGETVSIDEQTLGFQGQHQSKLRITYKHIGDGFQCDALCNDGYTFAFIFCHNDPPKSQHGLLNMGKRVIALICMLKQSWTKVCMDNFFNSVELARAAYREEALMHGVARTSRRRLPSEVVQAEVKVWGKVRMAVL